MSPTQAEDTQAPNTHHHQPSTTTTIIAEVGRYDVHKVVVRKIRGESIKLGFTLKTTEWMAPDLQRAFPKFNMCTRVHSIKKGSLAEQAGVLPKDVICWYSGSKPVVFHALVTRCMNATRWELIEQARFEEHVKKAQGEDEVTFYVARKKPEVAPAQASLLSVSGITLSAEVALKAKGVLLLGPEAKKALLQEVKEDAKRYFEAERDAVLATLPEHLKSLFNQNGFAMWRKKYLPVRVLSPYSLPPGDARDLWFKTYEKRKTMNSLHRMNHLVHWYGESDPSERYALIAQGNFLTWWDGVAKNYHVLPKGIQTKLDKNGKLSDSERARVKAQTELTADREKDRKKSPGPRIADFQELYELISERDLEEVARSSADNEPAESNVARRRKRAGEEDDRRPKQRYRAGQDGRLVSDEGTAASPEREESHIVDEDEDGKPPAASDCTES